MDPLHCAHSGRLATAEADLRATEDLNLSTAGPATLALTIERLRGALAEMIRSEREHHPDIQAI